MAVIRRNIATHAASRVAYARGVNLLKAEPGGVTTNDLGIPRRPGVPNQQLSTWDLFVVWHAWAMALQTPPNSGRNAAHSGPAFLPWHRWMMILLEFQFQRVLGDQNFGLPYWDWAADGERPINQQASRPVWRADALGGNGRLTDNVVTTGPFRESSGFRVRVEADRNAQLWATNRPLERNFRSRDPIGSPSRGLPRKRDVAAALLQPRYDENPWNSNSDGFRNWLEGWVPGPRSTVHNLVHVWIRGDMGPASSPNDPAFFLNHCNVDRIWAAWRGRNPGRPYLPGQNEPASLFRHRRNDPLYSALTNLEPTPAQMQNVANIYSYDNLNVD